ncbi:hypothetical protein [Kaistella sp.]|nr:hypothetical protein CDW55_06140 [Chryseobacterium sp. VAUSW3]
MRFLILLIMILFLGSCKKTESIPDEKRLFIVSEFLKDREKHIQELKRKEPDLEVIPEIELYDYPMGKLNFIITKDNKIFYHSEEVFSPLCGYGLDEIKLEKRSLSSDSLHEIKFEKIYPFLKKSSKNQNLIDSWGYLKPLSFSFESDSVKNIDIYKFLENIEDLGYKQYFVRRTAAFENQALISK